jgi:hypothetical protein
MVERIIADCLVLIHLVFICFVIFGGMLVMCWEWVSLFHLPAAIWGALIELQGGIIPLTPLEQHYRGPAGQTGYTGDFIEHYLIPIIYPSGLSRSLQIGIGIFVIAINLPIYGR